jgi:hypothetical protein
MVAISLRGGNGGKDLRDSGQEEDPTGWENAENFLQGLKPDKRADNNAGAKSPCLLKRKTFPLPAGDSRERQMISFAISAKRL